MDNKRVLLAFVLSFAVLIIFRMLFPSPAEPPVTSTVPAASSNAATAPAPKSGNSAPRPESNLPIQSDVHAEQAVEYPVETPLYKAILSNQGGVLRSFQLKGLYSDDAGRPVELINAHSGSSVGWPLAITTDDPKLDEMLAHGNYVAKQDGEYKWSLEFASDGAYARKTLEFDPDNYQLTVETAVEKNGSAVPHRVNWQAGFGDQSVPDEPKKKFVIYEAASKFVREALSGIKDNKEVTTSLIGAEDPYFMTMFRTPQPVAARYGQSVFNTAEGTTSQALRLSVPGGIPLKIYVGPKENGHLVKADGRLGEILDYGWFAFISKPVILPVLKWIYKYVGNYGWAIVLITCLVNLFLFPLRLKSQISMQKMQKIQPQINTLQDKYKKLKANDPRRAEVQAEMMKLYSEHGSPLGGCLPLVLQMPVLLAFYRMLTVSIELRHAPWILWIHDLSRPDPYYIIPIFMAIAMFIGQKMTPTTVDPAQAKMMAIMPLVMTFFFLWVQAGLTLYWLTSNLVGIGQQWFIRKYWTDTSDSKQARPNKKKSLPGS
jgi:YidC/Oxa1 family membrane protein insertase